jgi:hypothetical protein
MAVLPACSGSRGGSNSSQKSQAQNGKSDSTPKILTLVRYSCARKLWQYRLWSFKSRDKKIVRFYPKDEFVQRKLQYLLKRNNGILKNVKF